MAFLFLGGEDIDFENLGGLFVSTDSNTYRSAYARCSMGVDNAADARGIRASLYSASSEFFFSARFMQMNFFGGGEV